jgi:mRNA interferase RelE/StbE
MAKYSISFKASVAKDLRGIPKQDVARILTRINTLVENPRADGCIKLTGNDCYRVRQGLYRIVYEIHDDRLIVLVIKVGHRSNIYDQV